MSKLYPIQWVSIRYNKCEREYNVIFYRARRVSKQYFPTWGTVSLLIDIIRKLKDAGLADVTPHISGWIADVRKYTIKEE